MNRLRQTFLALLATVCLAGVPACGEDDVEREVNQAGKKAEKTGEKAKREAEKAKREAEKAKEDVDGQ